MSQSHSDFAPVGATWTDPFTGDYMEVTKDTIVNGITARVIEKRWSCYDHFRNEPCDTTGEIYWSIIVLQPEIIHIDEDKVYHLLNDSFYLLYDFSAKVGDILSIHAYESLGSKEIVSFDAIVDSLDVLTSGQTVLRSYHISDLADERASFYRFTGSIVEKLGKELYLFPFNNQDEDLVGFPFFGRCYEDDDFSHAASANCFVANRETTPFLPNVYPNPSTTEIFIDYPKSLAITNVSIFDVAGSFIMNKEIGGYQDRLIVPVNDLQSGYYVVCLTPNIRIPFIVIH